MFAIRQEVHGGPEVLSYQEIADPVPGPRQVRIAVAAAGVHLIDTRIRAGVGPGGLGSLPMTPGREVAGTVDAVGPDVDESWLGRAVVAHLGPASGGYAHLALASVDSLIPLREHTDPSDAVAMVGTGRTAMAILDTAALTARDTVVVTGAVGGLGLLLLQAAISRGATAIGIAHGTDKRQAVEKTGAVAIDARAADWRELLRGHLGEGHVTVVLDGVGGPVGDALCQFLGPGGRYLVHGAASGTSVMFRSEQVIARELMVAPSVGRGIIQRLGGMEELARRALAALAEGLWRPVVATYPLSAAAAAHRDVEGRSTIGKVVLQPDHGRGG